MESKKISNTPSLTDKLIFEFDHALKTLVPGPLKQIDPHPVIKLLITKNKRSRKNMSLVLCA